MNNTIDTTHLSNSMNTYINNRFSWKLFLVLTALIAGYAIFQGRDFIFGPAVMEAGDFAANALLITDARSFSDIYGNYSRWGFNHPGPFFFYWYALGEFLFFDLFNIVASPHQAHVLAGIFLQSALLSTATSLLSAGTGRKLTAAIFLSIAALILLNANNAISSIWMPHVLLGPYLVLIISCSLMAMGNTRLLPVATLMVCILCHGHVAQPLMSIPLLFVAILFHLRSQRSHGFLWSEIWRKSIFILIISFTIITIFLVPIIVDLTRCPNCNFERVLRYMAQDSEARPNWPQAINSIASFFVFDHNPERISDMSQIPWFTRRVIVMLAWLSLSIIVTFQVARLQKSAASKLLRTCLCFALFALLISCVWAKRITGPLYEFNSYFVYGIVLAISVIPVIALSLLMGRLGEDRRIVWIGWALAILVTTFSPSLPVFSAESVAIDNTPLSEPKHMGRLILLNQSMSEDWHAMTALGAWLHRAGGKFMVPQEWAYVFGWSRAFDVVKARDASNDLEIWEPGNSRAIWATRHFNPEAFCRISNMSSEPDLHFEPQPLAAARSACTLTVFGLGAINTEPYTWTSTPSIFVQLRGHHALSAVILRLQAIPYLGNGRLERQRVIVRVNGSEVATLNYKMPGIQQAIIPANIWNTRDVETIELSFPDAISPASLGGSSDTRALGIGIQGLGLQYE